MRRTLTTNNDMFSHETKVSRQVLNNRMHVRIWYKSININDRCGPQIMKMSFRES